MNDGNVQITPPPSPKMSPPAEAPYREWRALAISTLTAIATLIGSGILALPVTLYGTSLPVFMVLFTVSMAVQVTAVYTIIELLQRARLAQLERSGNDTGSPGYQTIPSDPKTTPVSLYDIADLFLPNAALRFLFYSATVFCFISLMVSYGLAGPQAVWQMLIPGATQEAPPHYLFIVYWTLGTFAVVFFVDQLLGVFGSFTVLKGSLFVGVVLIVALLPKSAHVQTMAGLFADFSGWSNAAGPFLMSCVALCGVSNTMPVTYNLLPTRPNREQIKRYRAAIILGVVLCYLLNVGWVLAVLQVVPRTAEPGKPSLTLAYQEGQISTVPLIDTLIGGHAVRGGVLKAIELIIEMFIFVSTGVSFFVSAAGMKSFVDGGVANTSSSVLPTLRNRGMGWLPKFVAYVFAFGSVLVIIVSNPKGFITVLTRFSSLTLNLQAGVFLFIMLYYGRVMSGQARPAEGGEAGSSEPQEKQGIALAMTRGMVVCCIVVGIMFFGFASALAAFGPLLGIKFGARE